MKYVPNGYFFHQPVSTEGAVKINFRKKLLVGIELGQISREREKGKGD
uniref:Uncharacterized protein n=1 Tax=Anguilla anguilla TaxID=7936 RepID=A0A0E9U520_ANGAN